MPRFYLTVYLAFVLILVIFGVLAVTVHVLRDDERHLDWAPVVSEFVGESVPRAHAQAGELEAWLARMHTRFGFDMTVFDQNGRSIAAVGDPIKPPPAGSTASDYSRDRHGYRAQIRLPDGRWLVAHHAWRGGGGRWLGALVLLAIAVGVGAYPVARRITRRVERLQSRVDALGRGELGARVEVEGRDEIAQLAKSFNRTAQRIEQLVGAQRSMLASASHELRSPLTRIRMATELLSNDTRAELRDGIARDVEELDELIEELLFASRLETVDGLEREDPVDLLALLAEEGARVGAQVDGDVVTIVGDPRLLRRLVRNLFENARRHGQGAPIHASVHRTQNGACLRVEDEGPGVPEQERERIFEPFYRPAGMAEGKDRGVGLGLALVQRIAQRHRGNARCLARDPQGTCFEVDLRGAANVSSA